MINPLITVWYTNRNVRVKDKGSAMIDGRQHFMRNLPGFWQSNLIQMWTQPEGQWYKGALLLPLHGVVRMEMCQYMTGVTSLPLNGNWFKQLIYVPGTTPAIEEYIGMRIRQKLQFWCSTRFRLHAETDFEYTHKFVIKCLPDLVMHAVSNDRNHIHPLWHRRWEAV